MKKTILIVDDDADIRTYLTTVLEENSYIPIAAANGEEGLKKIKANKPDLVILDVLMPRQSGLKMYRELRTGGDSKKIPVIILSAITKSTFLRSQEAISEFQTETVPEPDSYLEKPVEPDELAGEIENVLSRSA